MGARWAWHAICKEGHIYANFSGGADECYECGADCLLESDCWENCEVHIQILLDYYETHSGDQENSNHDQEYNEDTDGTQLP